MPRDGFEAGRVERRRACSVWRFHAGLFLRIPRLLVTSTDAMLTGVAVALTLSLWLSLLALRSLAYPACADWADPAV